MARLVIQQLAKIFQVSRREKVEAIKHLDLRVEPGELLVVLGPSGSGKTTLLRLIAGLEEIDAGTIEIDSSVVNQIAAKDRGVAMVFQSHALYPHLNVAQNLGFGLQLRKVPQAEKDRRVRETANLLGLTEHLERWPRQLSGGERQRAALGRALVLDPRILLLDEPLSHLDQKMRRQLRSEIARIQQQTGITLIYVTHDQSEAMHLGRRIAVMHQGEIEQIATPPELYQNPASLFVAGFVGAPAMNLIPGIIRQERGNTFFVAESKSQSGRADALSVELDPRMALPPQAYLEKPIVLGIRPENLKLAVRNTERPDALTAQLESIEFAGAETFVHLKIGPHPIIVRQSGAVPAPPHGVRSMEVDWEKVRWFDHCTGRAI
jgi:multiple sugar transport system ATP-binding protein